MSILVDANTKLLIQGMGKTGQLHAGLSLEFGTKVVGGVTPGRSGTETLGMPVFDTVREAVKETGANASVVFVPAPGAADAILEAADAGIQLVCAITEGVPVRDMLRVRAALRGWKGRLIGPNCPGLLDPALKVGSASRRTRSSSRAASAWCRAPVRSPTRRCTSSRGWASASRPAWASAAIRSRARASSTCSRSTRRTPAPRRWS
jgi:succinyl-CoA synthetase alpha subunit